MSTQPGIRRCLITLAATTAIVATTVPASATFPDQGKRVLFARNHLSVMRGKGAFDLFTMKTNGTDQERVVKTPKIDEYGGHWSPNGGWVTFSGEHRAQGGLHVYTARANGTHRRQLTTTGTNHNPNWSKNGSQIVWSRFTGLPRTDRDDLARPRRGATAKVMVMDADGTHKHSIYDGYGVAPGWHPSRALIAFSRADADSFDVWTVKPNGQGLEQFTDYGADTTTIFGDWAPDGDSFVISWSSGGSYTLYVAPTSDPTSTTPIAAEVASFLAPVFTPNGERVIFAREDGDFEIYSVRIDGTGEKQLTDNAAEDILAVIALA